MDALLHLDTQLFILINHLPHTAISNAVALSISGVGTAGIIWFIIATIMFVREEKKDRWFFAPLLSAGGASWLLVEQIIKPLVARSRPALEIDGYSFPSGHATIAFAMAVVLSHKEPKWKWIFYTLAVLISLSRIYLGVHYPLDVVFGAFLGWGIGRIVYATQR